MIKNLFKVVFFLALLVATGCVEVTGLIYSNTTDPITLTMRETPVGTKFAKLHSDQVKAPIGDVDLSAQWSSHAIGDAAKHAGLNTVYYADEHVVSILDGIWECRTIIVHGD